MIFTLEDISCIAIQKLRSYRTPEYSSKRKWENKHCAWNKDYNVYNQNTDITTQANPLSATNRLFEKHKDSGNR